MDIDLDKKLYNDYLNGNTEAFETLYHKYKDKIKYFVNGIVKNSEKAEDITQDVFMEILKNKYQEEQGSFKYYIYLIAKSKALNCVNTEKRRNEITQKYLSNTENEFENDILDTITKKESEKELLEAINILSEKYRKAIYLVMFENFSYKETAKILNISIQDVKNYIHRGKKEVRKILIKKGFREMNKVSKVFLCILCILVVVSGVVYAATKIAEKMKGEADLTPIFTGNIGDNDINSIWVGTFQLAWNEFMDQRVHGNVEFEDGESVLANELNKRTFTKNMLNENDYYIKVGETSNELKEQILKDIKDKFGIDGSQALEQINFDDYDENKEKRKSYTMYAVLYKNFEFLKPFDRLYGSKFNDSEGIVKYFGINNASSEELNENIEVLFFNSNSDFAVKLKTKGNEEVILYCNDSNKSFNELYEELNSKTENYEGNKTFTENDELKVPYINVDTIINYGELCGRIIKGTNQLYIVNAIQNVKFSLDEKGGNLMSEAAIKDEHLSASFESRYFYFNKPFVIFMKETDKLEPYFALKVDNTDVLVEDNLEDNIIM